MALGSGQAALLCALREHGAWDEISSVCELGSQVTLPDELADLFQQTDVPPLHGKFSARELYTHLLGATYTSIDFNGELGALKFDLNKNIHHSYDFLRTFDLVTNYGTSNCVFNQYEVFRNIHHLCRPGGFMIHTLPAQGWGREFFYKYNTNFIEDLASANHYDVLFIEPFMRLGNYIRKTVDSTTGQVRKLCDFVEYMRGQNGGVDSTARRTMSRSTRAALTNVAQGSALFNITIACAFRKRGDAEFVSPTLHVYREHAGV